ncbi:2-keto-4-pentenoate hydratase [Antarctobacter heliothermus]|uniref:2-oxo-hept-3-ene-1,7-dioate hydratase n=1 Tax=Antarctobacter heliothermus TaxID=74033 RepID=A0A239KYE5_9RHOB|nr:fumarylacetoacetate hydrolase family protein [Antarctobacter heliothermus]SNT22772.1 2-oxo-hept-3-ene-1,7-dioate hydratase [Antarctobacter heliothermus]
MSRFTALPVTAGVIALMAGAAWADCADDAAIAAFVADHLAKTPTVALVPEGTMEDARCTQEKVVAALSAHLGPVVGYKAGLTSKPAQERFGVTEPVGGVLYRDMLLEDGAEVPAQFGAIPLFEADLILVVGDDAINAATTAEEAITHISAVRPFIELPDLTFKQGEPINGVTLTAIGVAPRLGVMGAEIPVDDPAAMLQALAAMQVTVRAADGTVMAEAPGAAVLGNPVNSALWLISAGYMLKAGDLISVGSIGPLLPPAKAGGGASVSYDGLPGNPVVSVTFTD